MALAPARVHLIPARLSLSPTTCLHPASTTPEATQSPLARKRYTPERQPSLF